MATGSPLTSVGFGCFRNGPTILERGKKSISPLLQVRFTSLDFNNGFLDSLKFLKRPIRLFRWF